MEAKIVNIKHTEESIVVRVGYYEGENVVGYKTYYLKFNETVDDIKPRILDDLEDFKKIAAKAKEIEHLKDQKINLTGVKSFRETLAKERAQRAAELEKAEQEKKDKAAGK